MQNWDTLWVEFIYKSVKRVIQYFFFLIGLWTMRTSWISRKGKIFEKGGIDLEKVGYDPLTKYDIIMGIIGMQSSSFSRFQTFCGQYGLVKTKWIQRFKGNYHHLDTRRKLNVHKTHRRRLGRSVRPLNFLCTFNLHPVFNGW